MERDIKMLRSSQFLLLAAKELAGIDDDLRIYLLDCADDLLSKIKVDEEENRKVEEYGDILREELRTKRPDVNRIDDNPKL
jgi:hypothetical protein